MVRARKVERVFVSPLTRANPRYIKPRVNPGALVPRTEMALQQPMDLSPLKWRVSWFPPNYYIRFVNEAPFYVDILDAFKLVYPRDATARQITTNFFGAANVAETARRHGFLEQDLRTVHWNCNKGVRRVLPAVALVSVLGRVSTEIAQKLAPELQKVLQQLLTPQGVGRVHNIPEAVNIETHAVDRVRAAAPDMVNIETQAVDRVRAAAPDMVNIETQAVGRVHTVAPDVVKAAGPTTPSQSLLGFPLQVDLSTADQDEIEQHTNRFLALTEFHKARLQAIERENTANIQMAERQNAHRREQELAEAEHVAKKAKVDDNAAKKAGLEIENAVEKARVEADRLKYDIAVATNDLASAELIKKRMYAL